MSLLPQSTPDHTIQNKGDTVLRSFSIAVLYMVTAGVHSAGAQSSQNGGSVMVSAKVSGKSYEGAGQGSCRHTPTAAIYGVPAALWMVALTGREDAEVKSVNLTLWKPKNGSPQQFSVSLNAGPSSHRIDVGGRGEQVGSGKASVVAMGAGGRIEVSGKDASGKTIELLIRCPAFGGLEAEGG
jgi:hypothetical protein